MHLKKTYHCFLVTYFYVNFLSLSTRTEAKWKQESLFVCLKDPALGLSSYKPQQTFTSQTILKAKNKQKMIRFFKISTAFINVTSKRIVTH